MGTAQATVLDAAAYILKSPGSSQMTAMKLQKLCFYAQSWHHALLGRPLFEQPFEAWANGPVSYMLFDAHRGQFTVTAESLGAGNADALDADSARVVDEVLGAYGQLSAAELSRLTHSEPPWQMARANLPAGAMSNAVIDLDVMAAHCRSLMLAPTS